MKIFGVELRFNGFRIYHEGDKPTPSEIGAAASNHTHTTMGAASASVAGKAGLVPAPPAGKQGQFLRGDATWAVPYTHPTTVHPHLRGEYVINESGMYSLVGSSPLAWGIRDARRTRKRF